MRIKEGIDRFNEQRDEETPKMTTRILVSKVMPDMRPETAEQLIWHLKKGNKYNKITASTFKRMCEFLNVDADFLLKDVDVNKHDELDLSGMISVMKYSGMTPNKVLSLPDMT